MFSKLLNILSTVIVFFSFYYLMTNSLILEPDYFKLFWYYLLITTIFQLYYNTESKSFRKTTYDKFLQFIFTLSALSMILSIVQFESISRTFLFQTLVVNGFIHWIISFRQTAITKKYDNKIIEREVNFHLKKLFFSFIILILSFISVLYFKTGSISYYVWLEQIVSLLIGLWWVSSYLTRKFYLDNSKNIYYKLGPVIKSQIIFLLLSSVIFYFFKFDFFSRQLFFGSIILFSLIETVIFIFVFSSKKQNNLIQKANHYTDQERLPLPNSSIEKKNIDYDLIVKKLSTFLDIEEVNAVMSMLNKSEMNVSNDEINILSTNNSTNFQFSMGVAQKLIINLSKVNNYKYPNKMFIDIKRSLSSGGYFIGSFTPLEEDYDIMREKMPKFLFTFIYPIHFIFYRIFPKFPLVNYFYNFFTKGEGKFISQAEVFGRLNFCGFNIIDAILIRHQMYFIARLVKTESKEKHPSFGPIVKLKRIGYNKEIISIYKFRTMHPYSEFLQQDLYQKRGLNADGDKIVDDYRITAYGRIFRRFWIDELPQLINWIRGDVSLVGVRALSKAKFDLYPKDLQSLRTNFKPGLVPPFYVDMPTSFQELIESEKKYLNQKIKRRFATDIIYFFKAFNNIVFKGVRSQ